MKDLGGNLKVSHNLVDEAWADRPEFSASKAWVHDLAHAGQSHVEKIAQVAESLKTQGCDAAVLTVSECTNWLLNLRGQDLDVVPVNWAFSVVHQDATVDLFMPLSKATDALKAHLGASVRWHDYDTFQKFLENRPQGSRVLVEERSAPAVVAQALQKAGAQLVAGEDPVMLPKACKNAVEVAGAFEAHRVDGAALCTFLAWVETEALSGKLSEIAAADKLEACRRASPLFKSLSFPSISGAGLHGAIVHYRVMPETARNLQKGELYLIDSGGQYDSGTTDVTRTVAVGGAPTAEQKDRFTRVLKGHIALAQARFPEGTSGHQLDVLARYALWQAGLDYAHGTGHGVGSYISVHEGPHRISTAPNQVALRAGMIVSNEPGYYKTGDYGIRIENLVVVKEDKRPGDEHPMCAFDTLTLAPMDKTLIDVSFLTATERQWVDEYHARVLKEISPRVDAATQAWLVRVTVPL